MTAHIYFWHKQIEYFKEKNARVKKVYEDTAIDVNGLYKKYEKEIKKELDNVYFDPETHDLGDYYDTYQEKKEDIFELVEYTAKMHTYQFLALLCQTWENELVSFVNKEIKKSYSIEKPLEYGQIIEEILKKNMNLGDINGLGKIRELRLLTNVIKHGDGDSAERLRKKRPDYFISEYNSEFNFNFDLLSIYGSVQSDVYALNVNNQEFYDYFEAINNFWDSMPTRLFLDEVTPPIWE